MNTHDDPGPLRYYLRGDWKRGGGGLRFEIPVRCWPLMGALSGVFLGNEKERLIGETEAAQIVAAMGGNLDAHPDTDFKIVAEPSVARQWKHEWLDAAAQLRLIEIRAGEDSGRVSVLLQGYIKVVRSLLFADVNGGLDEEYKDFPDPPTLGDAS